MKDFRAPQWPDSAHPQQFHLDLDVPDFDQVQEQVVGLGATLLHDDTRKADGVRVPVGRTLPSRCVETIKRQSGRKSSARQKVHQCLRIEGSRVMATASPVGGGRLIYLAGAPIL
ncbi:VOC family protein [Streptomyces sp. NPDC004393]